jgi:hypothetical protein
METKARTILNAAGDTTLATLVLKTFKDLEQNYFFRSWKASSLDAGHFVEAVRRFLDLKLSGSYVPIENSLPPLNDRELKRLETFTGQDSYRLHIPRALVFTYGLRNKRGVGHLSTFAPNFLDATVILATCKWILAEILRLESTLTLDETTNIVDGIIEDLSPECGKSEPSDEYFVLIYRCANKFFFSCCMNHLKWTCHFNQVWSVEIRPISAKF